MFIEITNVDSSKEELINLEKVIRIYPINWSSIHQDATNFVIEEDSTAEYAIMAAESYKEIKKRIKKQLKETGENISRFDLMDL